MRILQICSARSIGGGERHVADLSNELTKRGHEVFLALAPVSPLPVEMPAVPSDRIATFPLRNAADLVSAIKLARFARRNNIQLINAHLAKDYPVAAAAARIARLPFVITRHVLFPMNRLHRLFLRDAKFVIAPSNAVANNLRAEGIFPPERIVTIRYGLDVDRFPQHVADHEGFVVGSVGNLDPVKGFDVLINAAALVIEEEPALRFVIVGEDRSADGRNEAELRHLIARLGLNDAVTLAGWSSDIRQKLAGFDLFVSASRSESFGFVIAEAMLSGVPVIAAETEGAKEIITDPSLGRLVPVASPKELADAIIDLYRHGHVREELSLLGRQHIAENFSLGRMVDETEALYRQIL